MSFTIKIKCPECSRVRNFSPMKPNKDVWRAQCFFCGESFKIYPKNRPSRVV